MQTPPLKRDPGASAEPAVLRRWGVTDCDAVDQPALTRSLVRLQDDERAPPSDVARLIRHIRRRYHRSVAGIIKDAVALATTCESAHSADDLWSHGLSDRLAEILDALEHHQQREDAVVFPLLLAQKPEAAKAAAFMATEHSHIRTLVDALSATTRGYQAPPQACATWRVLYILCCKIDVDIREQMRMEERELFSPLIRESTEAADCSGAMSG